MNPYRQEEGCSLGKWPTVPKVRREVLGGSLLILQDHLIEQSEFSVMLRTDAFASETDSWEHIKIVSQLLQNAGWHWTHL